MDCALEEEERQGKEAEQIIAMVQEYTCHLKKGIISTEHFMWNYKYFMRYFLLIGIEALLKYYF